MFIGCCGGGLPAPLRPPPGCFSWFLLPCGIVFGVGALGWLCAPLLLAARAAPSPAYRLLAQGFAKYSFRGEIDYYVFY